MIARAVQTGVGGGRRLVRCTRPLRSGRSSNIYRVVGLLLGVLMASMSAAAEITPPPPWIDRIESPATLRSKPATHLTLGPLDAWFERTPLSHILKAAKVGAIAHQGDAGESIYWLCYTVPRRPSAERLWVVSHGEMGGSNHAITSVIAMEMPDDQVTAGCPNLPRRLRALALDRGVWLGVSSNELIRALGKPSGTRDDWLIFHYDRPIADSRGEALDETVVLETRVVHGKVVALRAVKITSD